MRKTDPSVIHGQKCWPGAFGQSPCEEACPLHMDIPGYLMAVAQGKLKEALEIVRRTNPFPAVCGRVCHHPCEAACTRARIDQPVAIQWLKREIGRVGLEGRLPLGRRKALNREKVAVVGSGPAGLTAAHDLARKGFRVTVFEALPVAGGMMAAAIPEFNLPAAVVQFEVACIQDLGVEIKTQMRLGQEFSLEDLQEQGYQAVLLATGAWKSPEWNVPGGKSQGVLQALPFLVRVKEGHRLGLKGKVIIVGGGNVAIDSARTAARLGAEKVTVICLEGRSNMPAFPWEIEKAEAEGVEIFPSLAPVRMVSGSGGRVRGLIAAPVVRLDQDEKGKMVWETASGPENEITLEADWVIAAIGQTPDPVGPSELGWTERGTLRVNPETLATEIPGVFAAGDLVSYPGTIVEAIAAGHRAANSIRQFLNGKPLGAAQKKDREVFRLPPETVPPAFLVKQNRWSMPSLNPSDAVRTFAETELGYTPWQAREEAQRCLNCRMCGNCLFDKGQLCFETSLRLLS